MRRRALAIALVLASIPTGAEAQRAWSERLVGPHARTELRHPQVEARIAAARTLGRFGEPHRAVTALLEALEAEDDPRVRPALFEALARRGDEAAVPRLASRLGDFGREDRAAALRTIGAIGGESAVRVLAEWLGANDVGDDAAAALIWIGAPAVPYLLRALRVPDSSERAASVLGAIGDARATPALVSALDGAPPALEIAILRALAQLRDERAAPAVARALEEAVPAVAEAALTSLGALGGPEWTPALTAIADAGPPAQRLLALEALIAMDAELAAPRVHAVLRDARDPAVHRAVVEAVVAHPAPALVPALVSLAETGDRARAADALARIRGETGIDALIELGEPVPLALALRRQGARAEADAISRALAALRADESLRGAVILALARDASALDPLRRALESRDPLERAHAGLGLALLGPAARSEADRVAARLVVEDDPRAFRALALAAPVIGARVDPARLDSRWSDPETSPEALWLTAEALRDSASRTQRRARRAMRRALRAPDARMRAGAALALARASDETAWRALVAALDDEHDAVRLAVAHALASLAVDASGPEVAARERVEPNADVRAALRSVREAIAGRSPPAALQGVETLYVRVVTAPGLRDRTSSTIEVDVMLPDGRWLRTFTLAGGEVLLPDLPSGSADVQVRL